MASVVFFNFLLGNCSAIRALLEEVSGTETATSVEGNEIFAFMQKMDFNIPLLGRYNYQEQI
jgi:hypothetical protein